MSAAVAMVLGFSAVVAAPGTKPDPECGAYCLFVSLRSLDLQVGLPELREKLGDPSPAGYSMGQLREAAESFGAKTLAVETNMENLKRRPGRFACIAHVDGQHFVNLAGFDEQGRIRVVDPPRSYPIPYETLTARWDGMALLVSRDPLLAEEDLPTPISWPAVWMTIGGLACMAGLAVVLWRRRAGRGV